MDWEWTFWTGIRIVVINKLVGTVLGPESLFVSFADQPAWKRMLYVVSISIAIGAGRSYALWLRRNRAT
jgi:hypothetical protein